MKEFRDSNDVKYDILDIVSKHSDEERRKISELLTEYRTLLTEEILLQLESRMDSIRKDNGVIGNT
jgi:hypothetical protein